MIEVKDSIIMGRPTPSRPRGFCSLRELGYFYDSEPVPTAPQTSPCRRKKKGKTMNQPEIQAHSKNQQKLHPRVVLYAEYLGVEPQRFLRFLKRQEDVPGLSVRFRALRRLELRPIPLKELIARPDEKKARQSSAKTEATP
jgi:hypothetical protein